MFGKWIRATSLEPIQGPTRVKLRASVVSPNQVESPMTGLRAAALEWSFFVRFMQEPHTEPLDDPPIVRVLRRAFDHGHDYRKMTDAYSPVDSGRLGEELTLESGGKLIQVGLKDAELRFPGAIDHGNLVDRALPPVFSHLLNHPALRRGPLVYRELALSHGDPVILIATVEPVPQDSVGPYRSIAEAHFLVRDDLEPIVIEDQTSMTRRF